MFQERARTLRGLHIVFDSVCVVGSFAAAFALRTHHDSLPFLSSLPSTPWDWQDLYATDYALLLALSLSAWTFTLRRNDGHQIPHKTGLLGLLWHHAQGLLAAVLITSVAVFTVKLATVSRLFFAYYFTLGTLTLLSKDLFMRAAIRRTLEESPRYALLIASGKPASWFAQTLLRARTTGYHAVGVLWSDADAPEKVGGLKVLGLLEDLDEVLQQHPVDEVFVVGGAHQLARLAPTVQLLTERGRVVSVVTTLQGGQDGVRGRVTDFEGVPMLSWGPMPKDELGDTVKRVTDVVTASIALVMLSPVMLFVVVALKLMDPGPVLFSQDRLGLGGQTFKLHKFRSMRIDAEKALQRDPELYQRYIDNDFKLPEDEDPRISRLGRVLRKTSLDELPQLVNVLRGEMSMVGPRPIVPKEVDHYRPYVDLFLSVRPGVTGLWQVSGRSNVRYPERAFMDLDYIGNHSFTTDVSILLRTVPAVLIRKGAH